MADVTKGNKRKPLNFINDDVYTSGPVCIKSRGSQMFIEPIDENKQVDETKDTLMCGVGHRTDTETGETAPVIYKVKADKRQRKVVQKTSVNM